MLLNGAALAMTSTLHHNCSRKRCSSAAGESSLLLGLVVAEGAVGDSADVAVTPDAVGVFHHAEIVPVRERRLHIRSGVEDVVGTGLAEHTDFKIVGALAAE